MIWSCISVGLYLDQTRYPKPEGMLKGLHCFELLGRCCLTKEAIRLVISDIAYGLLPSINSYTSPVVCRPQESLDYQSFYPKLGIFYLQTILPTMKFSSPIVLCLSLAGLSFAAPSEVTSTQRAQNMKFTH